MKSQHARSVVSSLPRRRRGHGVGPQPPRTAGRGGRQQGEDPSTLSQFGPFATSDGGWRGAVPLRGYHGRPRVFGWLRDEWQVGARYRGLCCRANHGFVPDTFENH